MKLIVLSLVSVLLAGCLHTIDSTPCPPFPKAGPTVGEELDNLPFDGFEATWEWFGRLDKLKDQLDACRGED